MDRLANCTTTRRGMDQIIVNMEVKLEHDEAKLPFRKRETDAGYDIYSVEQLTLSPNRATIVRTGIHIAAPPGFYYTIEGRSSLWMKGIFPNRGIIDATYTGEVVVSLVNVNEGPFLIDVGDRIAQIILHRQYDADFKVVKEFSPCYDERGTDGFGSSGK
jgi:dUTP pyrophosphatase